MKQNKINWSEYYESGGNLKDSVPLKIRNILFDESGNRKIDDNAISVLTEYVNSLPQTKDLNLDSKTGDYTEERKSLHQRIMSEFKDELVCVNNTTPIAILMGGSPASGKSTFLKKYAPYLLKEEILRVDADEVRSMLPEYKGYNATQTQLETKDIVNTLLSDRTIGIPCKYDIIYDGTMNSTKSYYPLIKLLKELGYKIYIVYIDKVDKEVVKQRALARYQKSGRFVPMEVIEDFYSKGKSALDELKSKADGYMIVDGSKGDYDIIERGGMKLPKTRNYSKLGLPISEIQNMENGGSITIKKDPVELVGSKVKIDYRGGIYGDTNADKKYLKTLKGANSTRKQFGKITNVKRIGNSNKPNIYDDFLFEVTFVDGQKDDFKIKEIEFYDQNNNYQIPSFSNVRLYANGGTTGNCTPDYLVMFLGK